MQTKPLYFAMGCYSAVIPTDRQYAKNHMWAVPTDDGWRFGFTAYAVRLMLDVYFLDWIVNVGTDLVERQEIGQIESKKAESSLYCPMTGQLIRINEKLLIKPIMINRATYDAGWLFEMTGKGNEFLSPSAYIEHLDAVWEVTKQAIKGQMNQ